MLNQNTSQQTKSDERHKNTETAHPRTDWKRIANAGGVLTAWTLGVCLDIISDRAKRAKIEKAYRIGKACGKVSILIQKLQLPAELPDADSYRILLWEYLKSQDIEKIEFQPGTIVGDLDILIDNALALNCIHSLSRNALQEIAETTCKVADHWMVWVLIFCTDPSHIELLEQEIARTKTEYPIFVIPFQ